jgi:GNAT superfamily N-acetyltransferase
MDEPNTTKKVEGSLLETMNLHNKSEFDELLRQRKICGWDMTTQYLEAWRNDADAHTIAMFWVIPPLLSQLPAPQRYGGHIGMRKKTDPTDLKLTPADMPVLHLFNLFVLPEQRKGGLGRSAVQALEAWAKIEPYGSLDCKAITLNAISKQYIEDESEEWKGLYKKVTANLGLEIPPKGKSNEDWYSKMGYVKYDQEPMYPVTVDGKKVLLMASLLQKKLSQE